MTQLTLALGSTVTLYSLEEVTKALAKVDGQNGQGLRRVYEKMLEAGAERFVSKPSNSHVLDAVQASCPNFQGVLEDLANYIELAAAGKGGLNVLPILLCGDPGVGKTHFAKMLAAALNVPYQFVSMGTMTAGWILSGSAPTWSGARHGKIAEMLIEAQMANPVFLLDELDKAGGDARYDPHGALLQLLERDTAEHFRDEFLEVELDASQVLYVCTANDATRIPDYILSRMAVYEVPAPTPAQACIIAQNIYSELVSRNGWPFAAALGESALDAISSVPPREMKKKLLDGMAKAIRDKRQELRADDVRSSHTRAARTMGFCPT